MSAYPYGGAGDAQAGERPLSDRFRRHADSLVSSGRSPLCVALMRAAADDIDAGGVVAELFAGVPAPPGSVPQLRLLAALHYLVLSGQAPELSRFYPSAGGEEPLDDVWTAARELIHEQFELIRARLGRTVQTNEPGRSAVLLAGLLWLAERHRRPIRLLEVGASAGLNLLFDRYSYTVGELQLGDPASPLGFVDPWTPPPPIDLAEAAASLHITARAGCDVAPLDPRVPEDQLTLLSYIWPDEPSRIERLRAALSLAARDPAPIAARGGAEWLREAMATAGEGELVVVWHSVVRQYLDAGEWAAIEDALHGRPGVVRLSMEPARDDHMRMQLTVSSPPGAPEIRLAVCGDHGLPVRWEAAA
jgi:hypothetical protein